MRHHHKTLAMSLMAALSITAVQGQDAARVLVEQGRYWQARGDNQRAAQVWKKLLRVNPNQPEALGGMAVAEADLKRYEQADSYLAKLRKINPEHPALASAQASISLLKNGGQLRNARELAKSGKTEEAVASYQGTLGSATPKGPVALEYYQTLGGTSQGWDKARSGLEELLREQPNDASVQLALAQHLTYRENTRREGINQLTKLANNPNVGAAAIESWKKALVWTSGRTAYQPLYRDFLRLYPNDVEVRTRLSEVEQQQRSARGSDFAGNDPLRKRTFAALAVLDDGDTEQAEAELLDILKDRPDDADALGGLGIVRLRQENFLQARDLLRRAARGSNSNRWKTALDTANYWALVTEASTARSNGNLDVALQKLQQAMRIDPQGVTAENDLANVNSELGQLDAAETGYRRVLARQPDNPDALRGLVSVLSQNNKPDEALRIVENMNASQQEKMGAMGTLRASQSLGMAKAAAARGDDAAARAALDNALVNDPTSPWVRLELARLYLKMGAKNEARGIMDGLLASNPDMPQALHAHALLAAEIQDWNGALATLDKLPPNKRTRDMAALYKRVWVHVQADAATALGNEGRTKEAASRLMQAEPFAQDDPELQGKLALAYADLGDDNRAIGAIRQLLAKSTKPEANLRLQYAAVLFKTKQNAELAGVLRQIQGMPMTAAQRQGYEELRVGYTLRQVESLREAGELSTAYETLAPILGERPNDPQAVGALARLYAANSNFPQALSLYNQLLEREPTNTPLLLQAATMATSAKEYAYAESALQVALSREPQNPEVLTAIGRLYRAQGKTSKATEFFTAAVASEKQQREAQLAAAGVPAQAKATNPFSNRSEQLPRLPGTPPVDKNLPGALPSVSPIGQLTAIFSNAGRREAAVLTSVPPLPPLGDTTAYRSGYARSDLTPASPGPATPASYIPATYQPAPLTLSRSTEVSSPAPTAPAKVKRKRSQVNRESSTSLTVSTQGPQAQVSTERQTTRTASQVDTRRENRRTSTRAMDTVPAADLAQPLVKQPGAAVTRSGVDVSAREGASVLRPVTGTSPSNSPASGRSQAAPPQGPPSLNNSGVALPDTALGLDRPVNGLVQFTPIDNPPSLGDARITPRAGQAFNLPPTAPSVYAQRAEPYTPLRTEQTAPLRMDRLPQVVSNNRADRPRTALEDLTELQQSRIPTISTGAVVRSREGEPGLGQLTDIQTPVSLRFDTGESKVSVNVTPTSLFSGTPDAATATRFGAGPEQSVNNPTLSPGSQSASGVGLGVVYETDKLKADIGTTPVGFNKTDYVGGLKYRFGVSENTNLTVDVSRRPVTDSLLSFAGVKDARTGDIWGAVSSTGGRFDLSWDNGSFGLYTYGSAHSLTGSNVASNSRMEGGGGLYWKMDTGPNSSFRTGVNLTALGYEKNLRYFTFGQGGYFSPQRFFSVSVPVEWSQRTNKLSYQLKGSLGLQTFSEDASPYFPTNATRQANGAAAVAAGAGTPGITQNGAFYSGQSVSGLGYSLGGAMEYQIHPQLYVGGYLGLDNAKDYKQFMGSMYLRYFMDSYSGLPEVSPRSLKSPYAN